MGKHTPEAGEAARLGVPVSTATRKPWDPTPQDWTLKGGALESSQFYLDSLPPRCAAKSNCQIHPSKGPG